MWLKRRAAALVFLPVLLLAILFSGCGQRIVDVTMEAMVYQGENAAVQEACEVTFYGTYHESIFSADSYQGQIVIRNASITNPDEGIMELRFDDDIAVPTAKHASGYQYTPHIHSVLRDEDTRSLVLVLYNEYETAGDTRTGSFDPENPAFVCLGGISRADALGLISEHLSN